MKRRSFIVGLVALCGIKFERPCTIPPAGWYCTRKGGHSGPCAALPIADTVNFDLTQQFTVDVDWSTIPHPELPNG